MRIDALRLLQTAPRVAIASDAHGRDRMPSLHLALDSLRRMGERSCRRLVVENPRALLTHGLAPAPASLAA